MHSAPTDSSTIARAILSHLAAPGDTTLTALCSLLPAPRQCATAQEPRGNAALSQGVVVVEAGLRSGAMTTVGYADQLARPVMAVPGPVTSAASAGCHQLIAECGVPLVTGAAGVLQNL
jgi:DNA processing protein